VTWKAARRRGITRQHMPNPPEPPRFRVRDPELYAWLKRSENPLVLLDYDGTLRAFVVEPSQAVPDERVLGVLGELSEHAIVYVVSGRDAATLERWLGQLRIGLVAEHGLELRPPDAPWQRLADVSGTALTELVRPVFDEFTRLTPGSSVETKTAALTWHYRAADPEHGRSQALALVLRLEALLAGHPYGILPGKYVVEVRHEQVTKGRALAHLLERYPAADCLLCAGDDRTDEDMLRAIPDSWRPHAVTCWVGGTHPAATHFVESPAALVSELEQVVSIWKTRG
jgi:trehalose 6-phosphate synthase/phosphatase